ncbi:MAG: tetratricopeptide repeat protein [Bacteroidales bacterium]|nr:tetratricopeptide repeat protein [Bacteroidales bacterium]
MKQLLLILAALFACALNTRAQTAQVATQQTAQRDSVLTRARYLKSIFRTDEAIEILSAEVQPGIMDEQILAELADCHLQSGAYEDAAGTYFLLSTLAPGNILYKVRLMQAYYRLKAYPQSIQAGKAALQLDTIPAVVSYIGDAFKQMDQPDSALTYYRKHLELKPMNESVLSKAMGILIDSKDYDGAIGICGPFLAEDPENTTIAPLKGLALYRKGDYERAEDVFQRQEDIGNDSYAIHYYLGQTYWHTQVTYRAEQELLKAWQIDSSDANLAYSIAAVKMEYKSESYRPFETEIKPWLDKAWEMLQPDPAQLSRIQQQYGLGYYRRQDSWDKAIEHYQEAYRYNPKFISALSTIAYCYEMKKDYKQALQWYEKYLKVATPGSQGYEFVSKSVEFLKAELFMQER